MNDFADKLFWLLVGSIITGAIALFIGRRNRGTKARDDYLVVLADIRIRLDTARDYVAFHKSTVPIIEAAISKAYPSLSKRKQGKLERLINDYRSIDARDLNRNNEGPATQAFYKAVGGDNPPKRPSEIIKEFLGKFEKLAP